MTLRYGSVCSGIESASVAWHPLGWRAAWLAEIEPFCCALLAHHYPGTPNLGDMRGIGKESSDIDILVGGTPCQSFSVAGLRKGRPHRPPRPSAAGEEGQRRMNTKEWNQDDRFEDASGKMLARVTSWCDGKVYMERWMKKGGGHRRFSLPEKFFLSEACGWTRVEKVGCK